MPEPISEILIRVIDVETTDKTMPPENEIVEQAYSDLFFNPETKAFRVNEPVSRLFAPTKPLSAEVMGVHHITDAMLDGCPVHTEADLRHLIEYDGPMYFAAHNAEYEQRWLTPELLGDRRMICTFKCALRMFPEGPFSNQALKYHLGFGGLPEELCMPPHRGGPDSYVTAHILGAMLQVQSGKQLVRWTEMPRYYHTCPIGKWRGHKWEDVPADYLGWMLNKADEMEADLKAAAREELNRRNTIAEGHRFAGEGQHIGDAQ